MPLKNSKNHIQKISAEKKWKYKKRIGCESDTHSYKFFYLDEEVYRFAREDLEDLRIIDSKGSEAPYFIEHGATECSRGEVRFSSRMIGSKRDVKKGLSTQDFQITPDKKISSVSGHRIELTVPQRQYSKQIIIYGRNDTSGWQEIKRDSIYRFEEYKKDSIDFYSTVSYSYYRIEIPENTDNISISNLVLVGSRSEQYRKLSRKAELEFTIAPEESSTLISIENPNRLKVFHIDIGTGGTFNRQYRLFIRKEIDIDKQRPGKRYIDMQVHDGTIYNFNFKEITVSKMGIELYNSPLDETTLFVRIYNHSDRPLDISNITVLYYIDRVVFKSTPDLDYELRFGNQEASRPVYDITTYSEYVNKEEKDECLCDEIEGDIPHGEISTLFSDRKLKFIFNITITVISILLIFFLVRQLATKK